MRHRPEHLLDGLEAVTRDASKETICTHVCTHTSEHTGTHTGSLRAVKRIHKYADSATTPSTFFPSRAQSKTENLRHWCRCLETRKFGDVSNYKLPWLKLETRSVHFTLFYFFFKKRALQREVSKGQPPAGSDLARSEGWATAGNCCPSASALHWAGGREGSHSSPPWRWGAHTTFSGAAC